MFLNYLLHRMEEFILGKGAARQESEEVRVEGGDAVRELKRSMLEGTKVHFSDRVSLNIVSRIIAIKNNVRRPA